MGRGARFEGVSRHLELPVRSTWIDAENWLSENGIFSLFLHLFIIWLKTDKPKPTIVKWTNRQNSEQIPDIRFYRYFLRSGPWAWWAKLAYQVMLTIRGRLITPFVLGSMSVGVNILICHSFMDLWFWITALVPWPQLLFWFLYFDLFGGIDKTLLKLSLHYGVRGWSKDSLQTLNIWSRSWILLWKLNIFILVKSLYCCRTFECAELYVIFVQCTD